ncbi:stAR-related lipid transfer protein 9 isoform X3 [Lepus europaeus]|uniref:stAR-related lipid transfer protein 9 isoform X3 n=1 Tax=Lepus europaeus TaxID=9983 RepID=UPI002B48C765|nr:stAR-related lipid transfer protein 9 isoform X3 [Lepus europaeus]
MANVRVAVRVRPLSKRETKEGGRIIVEVDGKVAKIRKLKVNSRPDGFGDSREKVVAFGFDYCYWSVNPEDPQYASQDVVFRDLGAEVLSGATKGYNICLFAYGQTGSGKTYTMLGTPASLGLTPRICEGLFIREEDYASLPSSCRIKVSFLEIYNERVRDLLKQSDQRKSYTLRIREHPETGPYVQGLSQHLVTSYKQVIQLLEEGIANRITAATHVHETSSRSHAIFTIHYTQAILENNLPSEIASKINLVDLAGSERADPNYCKDRITEGANINKSLVTLGIVISTLAQNSQVFSGCQSLSFAASSSGASGGGRPPRRQSYIPYRDSVLTWLLKDSLGGNSRTIMVATVSPAHTSYNETMSTLRYASNAKNIINKPRVNEDANIKLIRELREEIERLKAMLLSFELRNFHWLHSESDENLKELVIQSEVKIDQLTKDWAEKWNDWQALMEHYSVDINRRRAGVVIDSNLPHLMALEDDVLSTGVVLYHLKEGTTKIGRIDSDQEQDIVLQGQWIERDHCTITSACGVVVLRPVQGARCTVNGREVTASCRLTQGAVITLGKARKFRFNHPAEAAVLRQRRQVSAAVGEPVGGSDSLEWLDLDGDVTASRLGLCPLLWKQRTALEEQCGEDHQLLKCGATSHRAQTRQQRCYVETLRQQILAGRRRAEKELELGQARFSQQVKGGQQWLLRETWLSGLQQQQQQQEDRGPEKEREASVADLETRSSPRVRSRKQLPRTHALWATGRNIRRRKIPLQLARVIKKQRVLEAQRRAEQLWAPCRLQDDGTQESSCQIPRSGATVPGPHRRNKPASCSVLSLRKLCSQRLPQLPSVFWKWDLSTMLPPMPDPTHQALVKAPSEAQFPKAASYLPRTARLHKNRIRFSGQQQFFATRGALARKVAPTPGTRITVSPQSVEMERVGKPSEIVAQGLASLSQSVNKLKPRNEPKTHTPTMTRKMKELANPEHAKAEWQKEENLGTHKPDKGGSLCPHGPKQAAGRGKAAKPYRAESKPSFPSRASKRHQKILVARVKDIARTSSHLLHGRLSKRQHGAADPDTVAPLTDSSPAVDNAREKDNGFSDTDSSYSADSLSCVCAKALTAPLKAEDPQGNKWNLPGIENSESDDSQISEDSLAEKEYQGSKDSPRNNQPTNDHGHPRTRTKATGRDFTMVSSDSGLLAQSQRSFSLDSLIDAEEELGEDEQKEPLLASANEMPTETFWRLQNSSLPVLEQEAMCRLGPINHQTGARLGTILPVSSSFRRDPQFQPRCEQPESEVEASYSERANSLQGVQVSRESPLVSMDSWFSCDSKISPNSPQEIVGSLCPSPDAQEVQPCGGERPGYWLNIEELKSSGTGTVFPRSSTLSQGSTDQPCDVRNVYTTSTSDTSKLALWGGQKLLQTRAEGIFQDRDIPDVTQQGNSEASQNSSVSSVLAASAASFTYVGSTSERDWAALQQKYLLELSHPVFEAIGEPRAALPCLGEDSASLAEASGTGGDTVLATGSGVSSDLNCGSFPIHPSKIRHLRAEKEQDSLNTKLESTSDFFSTSEKEVSYNETYSADLESLASGSTKAQVFATENKIPNCTTEAYEVTQNHLKECFQASRKSGLMASSHGYFFRKNVCRNHLTIATKADHWSHSWTPLRTTSVVQSEQFSQGSHSFLQAEKAGRQESAQEVVARQTDVSFAFSSGPELVLHSAPWTPLPSSLQPPPLETFYVTKSRDALTETALETPAYREVRAPSPPPREAWGLGRDRQALRNAYSGNNLPVLLQKQCPKMAAAWQGVAEKPVDLNAREVIRELAKCPGNSQEESSNANSVYFFVAEDRHAIPSSSTGEREYENQVGIFYHEGEEAAAQSCGDGSSGSSGSGKPLLLICESETGEEEQGQTSVPRQAQGQDRSRQLSSGARIDFIYKTTRLELKKGRPGESGDSFESRMLHYRGNSPVIAGPDESLPRKWEGENETGLLGKTLHPEDSTEEMKLRGTECIYDRCQSATCSQERNPSAYKGPGQEMLNPKEEPSGKGRKKRISNADEMARLIRSVMQLEDSILEIGSKQNKQLHASHTPGVSEEFVFQDQEKADHVLRTGGPGNPWTFEDQPPSPRQTGDVIFSDNEAGDVDMNSSAGNDPQAQKTTVNPFKSWEHVQESKLVREHTHPAELDPPTRDTCDSSGTCPAHKESTNTCCHPRRMTALAKAVPLQPGPQRSPESVKPVKASVSPSEQLWGLGKELKTVADFRESQISSHMSRSKQEEPKAQDRVEVMAMQRGGNLQEESKMVSLVQKLAGPCRLCMGTFFSPETVCPLLSQTDFTSAPTHQGLSNTLSLISPRLPRHHLHTPATVGASLDMLDLTTLDIHDTPLVPGHQDRNGETRIHSPEGDGRGGSSVEITACCRSAVSMAMGSLGQSGAPEIIPLGTEDKVSASVSPQDQEGNLRATSMGLNAREGLDSETEAPVQKELRTSTLNRVSRLLEKRVHFPLEDDNDQGRKARQKAGKEAEDTELSSDVFPAPASLPRVPNPEPRLLEPSVHASMCLAILEEIRQAKAQRKPLSDFVAEQTALPYHEALPDSPSGATGGPHQKQTDHLVSGRTGSEDETQGFCVSSPSADERQGQTTPTAAGKFHPLLNTHSDTGWRHPSQASSPAAPAASARELKRLLGAGTPCVGQSSSERGKKKPGARAPTSADPLASGSFLSSTAVEGNEEEAPEKVAVALPSQAPCDGSGVILRRQSRLAAWETVEGMPPGSQGSSPERQEPRTVDCAYGGLSGNLLGTVRGGQTAHLVNQSVSCDTQNSAGLLGPKQGHVQYPESSPGLEGRASPKEHPVLPGALRRAELEAPTQQCVEPREYIGSGLTQAFMAGKKHPKPPLLPDQRPSPGPGGVREEAPRRYPKGTLDRLVFSGSTGRSRTLSSPKGPEESRSLCRQLCNAQPVAVLVCASPSSSSLCYRDGDPGRRTSKAGLRTIHPPCALRSRACEMDEKGQNSYRESEVLLAHGLEPKSMNMELRPAGSSPLEPSTTTATLRPARGDGSPSVPEVRTGSFSRTAADGSSRSMRDPEKKLAEKKGPVELSTAQFPEPPGKFQDNSVGSQNTQVSHSIPAPTTWGPHPLSVSEDSVSELVEEPHNGCLESTARCLSEKTQLSIEAGDQSFLNPQVKFVTRLELVCSPRVESPWEEEEQQRDQALGSGESPTPPGDGGSDGCQIRETARKEVAVTESPVSSLFSPNLGQSETLEPAAHHRCSLPVIAVFSGHKHSKSSPRPQFSVVSSSRSLQELNLSVEPSSSVDQDTQEVNRLLNPHLGGCFSEKSVARTSLKAEHRDQKSPSSVADSPADHRPLAPPTLPFPTSTASCMPTVTSWMSGTLEQAQQGKAEKLSVQVRPGNWHSEVNKGMLHSGSSEINPCVLPQCPEGPVCIGWKQYVLGSVIDGSCSQKSQGLTSSNVAQCSSVDNGSEDQDSSSHSHLCPCAKTLALLGSQNSTENAQGSDEACKAWSSSFDVGEPHVPTGPAAAPATLDPDERPQFKDLPDKAGCLRHERPLAEGSAVGPVDETLLLCTPEAGCPGGQAGVNTFEQSTQTVGCRCPWSRADLTSAQPGASAVSASDLSAWTRMHNLSLHLSQLLHSTSELLRSLSQPSVTNRQHDAKKDPLEKPSQAPMMDGSTQTTLDKGSQTDLALPALCLQVQEAKLKETNMILDVLGSEVSTVFPERRDVSGPLQEEGTGETSGPPDLQEESTHERPQSPPGPSSHLRFQKAPLGQDLPSASSSGPLDASLPPSAQPKGSCVVVRSPSLVISQLPGLFPSTSESTGEPGVQTLSPVNALLVDRASSPILTLSASTQELGLRLGSLAATAPPAPLLESHQRLGSSPDLPVGAPRPPIDNYFQPADESGGLQRVEAPGEGTSSLERSEGRLFLESNSLCSSQQSSKLQVGFLEQPPQQLQPPTAIRIPSRLPAPPPRHESQRWAVHFVPEAVASPEHGPLSDTGPNQWQSRPGSGGEAPTPLVELHPTPAAISSCGGLQHLSSCPVSVLRGPVGLQGPALGPLPVCQPEELLHPSSQMCVALEPQHHNLGDLPVHNKFSNWCGVQDGSPGGLGAAEDLGASCDLSSGEQGQGPPQPPDDRSQTPEWSQREQIPLQVGTQSVSLSVELTEAKLHHGFGEADALLQVLQSGSGEALAPDGPVTSTWEKLHARQKETIDTLRRERANRLQSFRRAWSLSPQKQLSLLPSRGLPPQDLDLPSRRREYLQRLRKDVVETTRSPESASRAAHLPSDIELMLQEYQRAREEAKVEIARARARLRERTEQEKLRIRQQIVSQLLREEVKLHTQANSSSLCSSSNGSVSSGMTSGYNSSPALAGQLQSPESVGDMNLSDSRDAWLEDGRGRSAERSSHLHLATSAWKGSAYSHRPPQGTCCCSPTRLPSPATCFSSSYQDLAKHVVDTSMADVMAACSGNLHSLFSRQAAAGWNYQGEEQEVQLYYKVFSSTRHGFLGAGVVSQPLSHVWAAVSDPTLWPLFHKPIQTARLFQRVTNSINLVYLVCNTTTCALKQPRDFCCVCVEAKEVPALVVVKLSREELGRTCGEKLPVASGPLGEGLPPAMLTCTGAASWDVCITWAELTCVSVPRGPCLSWQPSQYMTPPCQGPAKIWSEEKYYPAPGSCSLSPCKGRVSPESSTWPRWSLALLASRLSC